MSITKKLNQGGPMLSTHTGQKDSPNFCRPHVFKNFSVKFYALYQYYEYAHLICFKTKKC